MKNHPSRQEADTEFFPPEKKWNSPVLPKRIAPLLMLVGIALFSLSAETAQAQAIPQLSADGPDLHPVFQTPQSSNSANRPALRIDVRDDSEGWFGTAEFYLAVQSSRFPEDVRVLFPVNRGDFVGCKSRYLQLPFEVAEDDVLVFNLLDNDELSESEEKRILDACQAAGYCLAVGSGILSPEVAFLAKPQTEKVIQQLGEMILVRYEQEPFDNRGSGEFIVTAARPKTPTAANRVALYDGNYVRVDVRVYFPPKEEI